MQKRSHTKTERELVRELSSAQIEADRLIHAMNLLENSAVDWFAKHTTINGCQHTFGVGIAFNLPLNPFLFNDFYHKMCGVKTKEVAVVFWRSHWSTADHRIISVFSPDKFKQLADDYGALSDESPADDPFTSSNEEIADMVRKAASFLDAAQERYRATRVRKSK